MITGIGTRIFLKIASGRILDGILNAIAGKRLLKRLILRLFIAEVSVHRALLTQQLGEIPRINAADGRNILGLKKGVKISLTPKVGGYLTPVIHDIGS